MSCCEPQIAAEVVHPSGFHRHWVWLAASALFLAAQIGPWFYPMPDAYQYLSVARGLAHGRGLTVARDVRGSPPRQPGYSVLISPVFLISDRPFWELSLLHYALAVVWMGGIYVPARRVAPAAAVWIAASIAANGALWLVYRQPLSDVAFACGCIWSINLVYAALGARHSGRSAWSLAAAALLAATCAVRYLGMAFALGRCLAIAWGAWRRQFPRLRAIALTLLLGLASTATVAALTVREHAMASRTGGPTYTGFFKASASGLAVTYPRGLQLLIGGAGRDMIPGMLKSYGPVGVWRNINMLLYVPLFVLLLFGWTRWLRRPCDPFAWTLPFYMAVLVAYSAEYAVRYCVPLLPALWVCLWFGLERLRDRRLGLLAALWVLHAAAGLGYWLKVDLPCARALDRQWPQVDRLVARIGGDQGLIAMDRGPGTTEPPVADFAQLVQLALDRRVVDKFDDPAVRDEVQWLIAPADRRPPPAFVPVAARPLPNCSTACARRARIAYGSRFLAQRPKSKPEAQAKRSAATSRLRFGL